MTGEPPTETGSRPARAFTPRAVVLGTVLALTLAWVTPWNDWYLDNSYLFNNYLPPLVTTVLLVMAVVVNPLLGHRRFARGELAVITALVLSVAGLASSGFARYWSIVVAGPSRKLVRQPDEALRLGLDEDRLARAVSALRDEFAGDFAAVDHDRDGRVMAAEAWGGADTVSRDDRDGDASLSRDEYVAGRLAHDARALATWRWALPSSLFLGVPVAGGIDANDAEYHHVVDGYLEGARTAPRVAHRARVTWRGPDGVEHPRQLALSGGERERHARADVLDLDDGVGQALAGLRAGGEPVATPIGLVEILTVAPPSTVPWYAWLGPALAWAPLVIGLCLASIAAAFLVRRQWLHNERLTYPVAQATMSLIEDPRPGSRLPPVLCNRAFWIAGGFAFVVVVWRGLEAVFPGHMPFHITLEIELWRIIDGEPWTRGQGHWWVRQPHFYLTFIGLAFLVPLDISFSLWACFLGQFLITMWLSSAGFAVDGHATKVFGFGSWSMLALLILWLGRRYYWAVLTATVRRHADPAVRAAVPYLYGVVAGMALIGGWLIAHGAPVGAAACVVLAFFGLLLVIARGLAEGGIPLVVWPENINTVAFTSVGAGLPVAALLPLVLIGMVLTDPREAPLPYGTTASHLADQVAAPPRRLAATMIALAVIGAAVACASTIWFAYSGSGHSDGYAPYWYELDRLAWRTTAASAREAEFAVEHGHELTAFGLGALVTGAFGVARMLFSWWPFHPLGLAFSLCYAAEQGWASFMAAWFIKGLVMRYGGVGLYRSLVPAAIGLAVGEGAAVCVFALAKIVCTGWLGIPMAAYHSLPG